MTNLKTAGIEVVKALNAEGFEATDMRMPPRPGSFDPGCIMHHWTASTKGDLPALTTVMEGRPGLTGPLYHFLIGRSGKIVWTCDGRANHAGSGSADQLAKALDGLTDGLGRNVPPDSKYGGGNARSIGVSLENRGEPIPQAQWDAWVALTAELSTRMGWTAKHQIFHSLYTTRKQDLHYETWLKFVKAVEERMELAKQIPTGPQGRTNARWDPAINLGYIVDFDQNDDGTILLGEDGSIYCFGPKYRGGPNDEQRDIEYTLLGQPAQIRLRANGYSIITDLGYKYDY